MQRFSTMPPQSLARWLCESAVNCALWGREGLIGFWGFISGIRVSSGLEAAWEPFSDFPMGLLYESHINSFDCKSYPGLDLAGLYC